MNRSKEGIVRVSLKVALARDLEAKLRELTADWASSETQTSFEVQAEQCLKVGIYRMHQELHLDRSFPYTALVSALRDENQQLREALAHYKNNPPPHPACEAAPQAQLRFELG